jgi:hypothetical protein
VCGARSVQRPGRPGQVGCGTRRVVGGEQSVLVQVSVQCPVSGGGGGVGRIPARTGGRAWSGSGDAMAAKPPLHGGGSIWRAGRRWRRMSNRIQRRAAVRSFCWRTHGLYTSRAGTHVVPSSLARAAGGPCPPRLSVPPVLPQNHDRTRRRSTTDAVPSTIYIIDPAFWPLPRFFGAKVASTALQPFSGCEGG